VKILALTRSLIFTNVDFLRDELLNRICPINLDKNENDDNDDTFSLMMNTLNSNSNAQMIILDLAQCNFIDESGAKCLKEIVDTYARENVKLLLTNCNGKCFLKNLILFLISIRHFKNRGGLLK
jgi:hypothetical protein